MLTVVAKRPILRQGRPLNLGVKTTQGAQRSGHKMVKWQQQQQKKEIGMIISDETLDC